MLKSRGAPEGKGNVKERDVVVSMGWRMEIVVGVLAFARFWFGLGSIPPPIFVDLTPLS